MGPRRLVLLSGLALLVATATRPVRSGTELEATEYAGSTTGGWTCGPVGQAKYAGVGAELRIAARAHDDPAGPGWAATVGAGLEYERVRLHTCDSDRPCNSCPDATVPPNRPMAGVGVRGGYYFRWLGAEVGTLLYSAWQYPDDAHPAIAIMPQLELSVGRRHVLSGIAGIGSPLATTYRRPALAYGGLNVTLWQPHELLLRGGLHRTGASVFDSSGLRFDAVWRFAVTDSLRLRLGGSLGQGGKRSATVDYEGSFGLITKL